MLFRAIPDALGHPSLPSDGAERGRFLTAVERVWDELESADTELLERLGHVAFETLGCASTHDTRAQCRDYAGRMVADSRMHHGFEQFLDRLVDDSISDDRGWFSKVLDGGLGIPTPIHSWGDGHASQAEFLLRRNLLAMQRAGRLLAELQLEEEARPFALFWPNPDWQQFGSDVQTLSQRLSAMVREIPRDERVPVIVNLAREFRGVA